jgi:hypothetical protein
VTRVWTVLCVLGLKEHGTLVATLTVLLSYVKHCLLKIEQDVYMTATFVVGVRLFAVVVVLGDQLRRAIRIFECYAYTMWLRLCIFTINGVLAASVYQEVLRGLSDYAYEFRPWAQ